MIPGYFDIDLKKFFRKHDNKGVSSKDLSQILLISEILKIHEDWAHRIWKQTMKTHEAQAGLKSDYSCEVRIFVLKILIDWSLSFHRQQLHYVVIDFS